LIDGTELFGLSAPFAERAGSLKLGTMFFLLKSAGPAAAVLREGV